MVPNINQFNADLQHWIEVYANHSMKFYGVQLGANNGGDKEPVGFKFQNIARSYDNVYAYLVEPVPHLHTKLVKSFPNKTRQRIEVSEISTIFRSISEEG